MCTRKYFWAVEGSHCWEIFRWSMRTYVNHNLFYSNCLVALRFNQRKWRYELTESENTKTVLASFQNSTRTFNVYDILQVCHRGGRVYQVARDQHSRCRNSSGFSGSPFFYSELLVLKVKPQDLTMYLVLHISWSLVDVESPGNWWTVKLSAILACFTCLEMVLMQFTK